MRFTDLLINKIIIQLMPSFIFIYRLILARKLARKAARKAKRRAIERQVITISIPENLQFIKYESVLSRFSEIYKEIKKKIKRK